MQINAVISEIVHCADKPGVVLEGGGLQFQPLGEGGHDAFAHLRGQRVYQKRLLRADAAADQDQLRVEDVYKARKALGDLVDPAVEHSQRAGVACGGSLKDRTPVGRVQPGRLGAADQRRCGVCLLNSTTSANVP